jgi:DNA-directed RNA polymerase specialized sigma24 family protein
MTIETVYTSYKSYFVEILQGRGISEEKSVAIYQDAVVSLFHTEEALTVNSLDSEVKSKINEYLEASIVKLDSPAESLSESQKQLLKQYQNLPESQQEILHLYYYKNLSVPEISTLNNQKKKTISETKERAVRRLQHLVKSNE